MMKSLCHLLSKAVFMTCGLTATVLLPITVQANDSAGYVATGGVEYIKNKNISMHSEDLYISKDEIRVNYEFKNLSNKDITETILFPMPAIPSFIDSDYADIDATYDSFKIWVNGRAIQPKLHVRTFMSPLVIEDGYTTHADEAVDTTDIFTSCGINKAEMLVPWTYQVDAEYVNRKLLACDNPKLTRFIDDRTDPYIFWDSQIIYSWQQTFKANSTTTVKHTYAPLVGGSVHLGEEEFGDFCVDDYTRRGFHESGARPYEALSYILTTGANWAKPIKDFTLTVERDNNELVSFCWQGKGKVKKIAPNTFQIKESDFVPTHDFNVIFIHNKF
ncbi:MULTISPECIES: DUF4424 family protein [unclassified Psychrobacter]|uniref:DUF4424 family protein n=1 Tax=unclassified Psychrobacter TaxID=196806 RepID=UPI001D17FC40|nr:MULTISPECIES: DUF4424 family protein [unclassified Psychrobacter]